MDESKDKLGLLLCVISVDSSLHNIYLMNAQQQIQKFAKIFKL